MSRTSGSSTSGSGRSLTKSSTPRQSLAGTTSTWLDGTGSSCRCLLRALSRLDCALLGVLKAGGAYVPLDPGYPDDRLLFMLQNAGCPNVAGLPSDIEGKLTAVRRELPDEFGRALVWLDGEWEHSRNRKHSRICHQLLSLRPLGVRDLHFWLNRKPKGVFRLLIGTWCNVVSALNRLL